MLSGISTGCPGNVDSTAAVDRENECNCEYGGVYVCAESVNNADVSTSSLAGVHGRGRDDISTSCTGTAGAADIITSCLAGGSRNVGV